MNKSVLTLFRIFGTHLNTSHIVGPANTFQMFILGHTSYYTMRVNIKTQLHYSLCFLRSTCNANFLDSPTMCLPIPMPFFCSFIVNFGVPKAPIYTSYGNVEPLAENSFWAL